MAHAAVAALRCVADSKTATITNAPSGGLRLDHRALFLQRFVEQAKSWLHWIFTAGRRRPSRRGPRAANARRPCHLQGAERALCVIQDMIRG